MAFAFARDGGLPILQRVAASERRLSHAAVRHLACGARLGPVRRLHAGLFYDHHRLHHLPVPVVRHPDHGHPAFSPMAEAGRGWARGTIGQLYRPRWRWCAWPAAAAHRHPAWPPPNTKAICGSSPARPAGLGASVCYAWEHRAVFGGAPQRAHSAIDGTVAGVEEIGSTPQIHSTTRLPVSPAACSRPAGESRIRDSAC